MARIKPSILAATTVLLALPAVAQDAPTEADIRDAHATLLGLARDDGKPQEDDSAALYYSIVENPDAPRLVTRLQVGGVPCRARFMSALQFPGQWATVTFGMVDLRRVTSVLAYASADDMIAGVKPVPVDSEKAVQIVLTGKDLHCATRVSLSGEAASDMVCADRLDLTLTDAREKERARKALAIVAGICKAPAFVKK
ncbi:hypothetical protein GR158_22405 [Shinella sp. AETb1-6]|uniref:hypothetical protein n=1 Tax=Shinella sp. AETb1-6 TaxID=2692210 RepID=UPI00136FEB8D|nr:hypothetical protein [Shinella sp. AETb1-6]MXN53859.1 hypothetical protein [Shinella sp. AETb1-6]